MAVEREIRADYDRDTFAIYQAYSAGIADAATGTPASKKLKSLFVSAILRFRVVPVSLTKPMS